MSLMSRRQKSYIEYKRSKAEIIILECEIRSLKREILSKIDTNEESNHYKKLNKKIQDEENLNGGYDRGLVVKHINLLDRMNNFLNHKD